MKHEINMSTELTAEALALRELATVARKRLLREGTTVPGSEGRTTDGKRTEKRIVVLQSPDYVFAFRIEATVYRGWGNRLVPDPDGLHISKHQARVGNPTLPDLDPIDDRIQPIHLNVNPADITDTDALRLSSGTPRTPERLLHFASEIAQAKLAPKPSRDSLMKAIIQ